MASLDASPKPKLLICELWGIGDLVLATTLLRLALVDYEVHLLAKPHARPLLQRTFPGVVFHEWIAPWTAHSGKYRLWEWPWRGILRIFWSLWRCRFDAAVSVRPDPRDHLLMWLVRARRRFGFGVKGSALLLNEALPYDVKPHRVESWRSLAAAIGLQGSEASSPELLAANYGSERVRVLFDAATAPVVCLHTGAAVPLRRWPEEHLAVILGRLRELYHFQLLLIPDQDGFGSGLASFADSVMSQPTLDETVAALGSADVVFCNDSGPMHVAAASGRPVLAFFGPGNPDWFRPFGDRSQMIIRDICPYRPCFDYCRFPEPYCLTKLLPNDVWSDITQHLDQLVERGIVPSALRRSGGAPVAAATP